MKTLKNLLILFVVTTLAISFAWSKEPVKTDNPLVGTWRTAADIPNGSYGVKSFTNLHFNWYYTTAKGLMYSAGAGTYKILSDSTFVESLEASDARSEAIIGKKANIVYEIKGDTLFSKLDFMGQIVHEKWIRVD